MKKIFFIVCDLLVCIFKHETHECFWDLIKKEFSAQSRFAFIKVTFTMTFNLSIGVFS